MTHYSPFQPHPLWDSVHLKLWQNDKNIIFGENSLLKAHVPGNGSQTSCFVGLQKKKLLGNNWKHVIYSWKQQNRPMFSLWHCTEPMETAASCKSKMLLETYRNKHVRNKWARRWFKFQLTVFILCSWAWECLSVALGGFISANFKHLCISCLARYLSASMKRLFQIVICLRCVKRSSGYDTDTIYLSLEWFGWLVGFGFGGGFLSSNIFEWFLNGIFMSLVEI